MLAKPCGCPSSATGAVSVDLLGLFRLQGRVFPRTINAVRRAKFRASAIRQNPAVFSEINQSAWQPVNVPAPAQVDMAPEYMPPWPFNGDVGYLQRQGYSQNPKYGQMQPAPALGYSLVTPGYSTLPWIVYPGGSNG